MLKASQVFLKRYLSRLTLDSSKLFLSYVSVVANSLTLTDPMWYHFYRLQKNEVLVPVQGEASAWWSSLHSVKEGSNRGIREAGDVHTEVH